MKDNRYYTFKINDVTFILNRQYSAIGYCYPRLFVEIKENEEYGNIDLSLGAMFKMYKKDWDDWMSDAEEITDAAEVQKLLESLDINYGVLLDFTHAVVEQR